MFLKFVKKKFVLDVLLTLQVWFFSYKYYDMIKEKKDGQYGE